MRGRKFFKISLPLNFLFKMPILPTFGIDNFYQSMTPQKRAQPVLVVLRGRKFFKVSSPPNFLFKMRIQPTFEIDNFYQSILFLADGQPLLVVLRGNDTVDTRRLCDLLSTPLPPHSHTWGEAPALRVPVRHVELASRELAQRVCGYRVGTIGPFAHPSRIGRNSQKSALWSFCRVSSGAS